MKKTLILTVLAAIVLSACARAPYPGGKMVWRDTLESKALAGNLLRDSATRAATIYLPASYDTSQKRYPVLYVLQSFHAPLVDPTEVSKALDQSIDAGQAREIILVFIDGFNALGGSWYLSSPTVGDWDTFISQELVGHIDRTYRTLSKRDSRAITGCSMGGYGALHMAFLHPEIYSVAAANSLPFGMWEDAGWTGAQGQFKKAPADAGEVFALPFPLSAYIAAAAAAAPDPSRPPLYLNMPIVDVNGQPQIMPEVKAKIDAIGPAADLKRYLAQSTRLRGLMIYHGTYDDIEYTRDFDNLLSQSGVKHQYLEADASHCALDWTPVLKFASDSVAY